MVKATNHLVLVSHGAQITVAIPAKPSTVQNKTKRQIRLRLAKSFGLPDGTLEVSINKNIAEAILNIVSNPMIRSATTDEIASGVRSFISRVT